MQLLDMPSIHHCGKTAVLRGLHAEQILEDVSEEHARKTITVDPFPHSGVPAASIHPCKHASVMKKLGSMAEANGKPFQVDRYAHLHAWNQSQWILLFTMAMAEADGKPFHVDRYTILIITTNHPAECGITPV